MNYKTITFIEKNITFRGATYNIKALNENSLKEQEEKLINSLMKDFKHISLIKVEEAIEHANNNNIEIPWDSQFGAFLCTIP